jgi:hypothetical protein
MNTYKPNVTGLAELILKSQGGALAKTAIHRAFVNYKEISKEQYDDDLKKSTKFGVPTFDMFSFNCTSTDKLTYKASKEFGGGDVILSFPFTFETALIEVNQTKNIVKTSISGLNGTVKEYMSEGDNIINLKGVIVGGVANQRPDVTQLNSLIAYLNAPLTLPISCNFLNELLITSVIIESYKFGQREGARNVIDIEINMISDTAIVLSTSKSQKDIFTPRAPYVQRASF